MLAHIYIRDFAIIREIDIDLDSGFSIITGETGTGKSIVIQAVSMALGGRGSSSLVRKGCDRALVQLIFSLTDEEKRLIEENCEYALDSSDEDLILSRDIHASGKSIARINGRIVNLSVLSSVASVLMDIHGQYDNQTLLRPENHRNILDGFAGSEVLSTREKLKKSYSEYDRTRRALAKLRREHSEYLRRQDFLRYEADEIDSAAVAPGEDEELSRRLTVLQNSEKIYSALSEVYEILSENRLDRCTSLLSEIAGFDPACAGFLESIQNCMYTLEDVCAEVRKSKDSVSFEPEETDRVLGRLDLLDRLKRKYGGTLEKVMEYRDNAAAELDILENIDEKEQELKEQLKTQIRQVDSLSAQLTEFRQDAASRLSQEMSRELSELNFRNVRFEVRIQPASDSEGRKLYSAEGTDIVEFFFSANKGEELKPLASVASGGEISRISLAFKCLTDSGASRTMIFDEIDTGISGITASVVGRKMSQLGRRHQILCITHLPQIAAAGDSQYQIAKDEDDDSSYTTISRLGETERITEIARLLGGANITETTLASARELLENSGYRQ